MDNFPKKIALVYDRVNKWGGAEEVLLALHEIFPDAPLYTSVYSPQSAPWAKVFPHVYTSFLQKIPFLRTHHEWMPFLMPLAFESFNFHGYDAVISVTSSDAKGIITPPGVFHFCYCLTPTRYLWSHRQEYSSHVPKIFHSVFDYLQRWDLVAAARPDALVSISNTVKDRVGKFYHRDSEVLYPPVNTSMPKHIVPPLETSYFLYLGRLVSYKNPYGVIQAFNQLGKQLVVIGSGAEEKRLKKIAQPNIAFKGFLSHAEKLSYLKHCQALVFFHEEDFGIVPVEAQAHGRPVIALNKGALLRQ